MNVSEFVVDYCQRHAHPVNAVLHVVGVPATFAGVYFICVRHLSLGLTLLVAGYLLQYVGHEAQGNEVGEITLIKKIWRRLSNRSVNTNSSEGSAAKRRAQPSVVTRGGAERSEGDGALKKG